MRKLYRRDQNEVLNAECASLSDTQATTGSRKVSALPHRVAPSLQPKRKKKTASKGKAVVRAVSTSNALAKLSEENPAIRETPDSADVILYSDLKSRAEEHPHQTKNSFAIEARKRFIEEEYSGVTVDTSGLPAPVAATVAKWLEAKNLTWCLHDKEFWSTLPYYLTTIESFSVEAIEETLKLCLSHANNSTRRITVYNELRAVREIKKIRNYHHKLRTATVLAERFLLSRADVARGERSEYEGFEKRGTDDEITAFEKESGVRS
jgi:hypothetical protein